MLNEGYEEYKKNHPDFARVVEKEEGKPEESYGNEKHKRKMVIAYHVASGSRDLICVPNVDALTNNSRTIYLIF